MQRHLVGSEQKIKQVFNDTKIFFVAFPIFPVNISYKAVYNASVQAYLQMFWHLYQLYLAKSYHQSNLL